MRAWSGRTLRVGLLGLAVALAGDHAQGAVDVPVDLPSASTGSGTLALRIFAPSTLAETRYPEGAPVVIFASGGTDTGSLGEPLTRAKDMVRIMFLFPGGRDRQTGRSSGGTYDQRGPNCVAALRDVIRYAAGELVDSQGRLIDDVVPVPVLHTNIGLLGSSNGGNIVVAVAAQQGGSLSGRLRYLVQWESPVSSQIATADLGPARIDCGPGKAAGVRSVNPRYEGYGPLEIDVDYSQVACEAGTSAVFLDGNGDARLTTVTEPGTGCRTPDLNLNGVLEPTEDFPLGAYSDGPKKVYSRGATRALVDRKVFGSGWPGTIATFEEATAYWDSREAVRLYGAAAAAVQGLEGMILASLEDHVQVAPDHPHIRQAFDGWVSTPSWVQVNPSHQYLVDVDGALAARTDLPQSAPRVPPRDWNDASSYCLPEDVSTDTMQAAAVRQMADRARGVGR